MHYRQRPKQASDGRKNIGARLHVGSAKAGNDSGSPLYPTEIVYVENDSPNCVPLPLQAVIRLLING